MISSYRKRAGVRIVLGATGNLNRIHPQPNYIYIDINPIALALALNLLARFYTAYQRRSLYLYSHVFLILQGLPQICLRYQI